jgi:RNA polymerase sigma-70 factor (ECF subfamily)
MSLVVKPTPIAHDHTDHILPPAIRQHLGAQLRALYGLPEEFSASAPIEALLERLDAVLAARGETLTAEVRAGLTAEMPSLMRFALSLTKDPVRADDLVQETLLRAWRSRQTYQADTNLAGWLAIILRNTFYSIHRKHLHEVEDPDEAYAAMLSVAPAQEHGLRLQDMQTAMTQLSPTLREALVLIVLNDLSYEQAAAAMGCNIGTIKSRIFRARERLAQILGYTGHEDNRYGRQRQG